MNKRHNSSFIDIVLLILAGITISISIDNTGLFNKATEAKLLQEIATIKESVQLQILLNQYADISKYDDFNGIFIKEEYKQYLGLKNGILYVKDNIPDEIKENLNNGGIRTIKTANGINSIKLEDYNQLISLKANGDTIQGGEASTENIESLEEITIKTKGKNLLDGNTMKISASSYTNDIWSFNNGTYDRILNKEYFTPKTNTEYTLVLDIIENTFDYNFGVKSDNRFFFKTIGKQIKLNKIGREIIYLQTWEDFSEVTLGSLWFCTPKEVQGNFKCKMMLLEGRYEEEQIGEYEPYKEHTTNTIQLNPTLNKIEETADYIDFVKSKIIRNTGRKLLDGKEIIYQLPEPVEEKINIQKIQLDGKTIVIEAKGNIDVEIQAEYI